jgi:SAM-dependent methyltransferase
MDVNRDHWEEAVGVHVRSQFYDVEAFKKGKSSLMPLEVEEVGDVRGKTLLHLQCHFGMDTLSWAREGADVTGIDFSGQAIDMAKALANELGLRARFLESNIYELPQVLEGQFDIVFASYGVLTWIPDVEEWCRIAASYVRVGGTFYIVDGHPFARTLWDSSHSTDIRIGHNYFHSYEPTPYQDGGTYAETKAILDNSLTYEYQHSLSDIITSLVNSGLQIEFLHEHPLSSYESLPGMKKSEDGFYRLPQAAPQIPFLFSIKATK